MEGKILVVLSRMERKIDGIEDRLKAVEHVVCRIRREETRTKS
jgi:hypothetical protein